MNFKEWWDTKAFFKIGDDMYVAAEKAWDYQQIVIDELQFQNSLYEREVDSLTAEMAHWRAMALLLQDKIDGEL